MFLIWCWDSTIEGAKKNTPPNVIYVHSQLNEKWNGYFYSGKKSTQDYNIPKPFTQGAAWPQECTIMLFV